MEQTFLQFKKSVATSFDIGPCDSHHPDNNAKQHAVHVLRCLINNNINNKTTTTTSDKEMVGLYTCSPHNQ
jgi:hypothetical protein